MTSGLMLPVSLSLAMFRLSAEELVLFPSLEVELLLVMPHSCSLLSYLEITWYYMIAASTLTSVLFR